MSDYAPAKNLAVTDVTEAEDPNVDALIATWQYTVLDIGLPPLWIGSPGSGMTQPTLGGSLGQVSAVMLSGMPDERIATMIEGGRQAPGCLLLALSHTWLFRRELTDTEKTYIYPATHRLYIRKGIWMDSAGRSYLQTFSPPRLVTYFANFMTIAASGRADGVPLEKGIDCPVSSSSELEQFVGDKLWTRLVVERSGVPVPYSCAIIPADKATRYEGSTRVRVFQYDPAVGAEAIKAVCTETLNSFLEDLHKSVRRFVIKPSGPLWMASKGVKFFDRRSEKDVEAALAYAIKMVTSELHKGDALLFDEFLDTMQSLRVTTEKKALRAVAEGTNAVVESECPALELLRRYEREFGTDVLPAGENPDEVQGVRRLGFRLRVIVARDADPKVAPTVSKFVCGVGYASAPLNGDTTAPQTLEVTLSQWGIQDGSQVIEAVRSEARKCMQALARAEDALGAEERGPRLARTDMIGIDFVLVRRMGVIIPFVIEINDHDCTDHMQIIEFIEPETLGEGVRPWVRTMMTRSTRYLLEGSNVAFIGCGSVSKKFVFQRAASYGVRIYLVDDDANHYARTMDGVAGFVHVPEMIEHSKDDTNAEVVVRRMREVLGEAVVKSLDGVITFWDDCGPLCSRVARLLGLPGNDPAAHDTAKSKARTHAHILGTEESRRKSPNFRPAGFFFATPSYPVKTEADLRALVDDGKLDVPFVLKHEYGAGAVGVKLVISMDEAANELKTIQDMLTSEETHPGSGLSFKPGGASMMAMDFLAGQEFDVDVVLHNGVPLVGIVTANGPTHLPYFCETAHCMPAVNIHPHQAAALRSAAIIICREIGLLNGCFNLEFKLGPGGPKLIEVNARMGGFYICKHAELTYNVDLVQCAIQIACGQQPLPAGHVVGTAKPERVVVGAMLLPSQHREALEMWAKPERLLKLQEQGVVHVCLFEDHVPAEDEAFEEPVGNIACSGATFAEASAKLVSVLSVMQLDDGEVPVSHFISSLAPVKW